jgi:glycosyltransferase involved in cell wall biosynthesis
MTVRDGAPYLAQALTSLRAQTFPHWELVLRDDGSTDDSLAIAQEFAAIDARIRVFTGPNVGRRRALVEAHAEARGNYLAWLDADDWLDPKTLEKAHWALSVSHADLVYTDHIVVGGDGQPHGLGRRTRIPYSSHRLLLDFMTFHFRLFTRDIFERAGGIADNREIAIDYDLCLRISEIGRIQHLAEPLYFYRQHAEQMSSRRRAEQIAASASAIRAAIARRFLDYDLSVDESRGRFQLVHRTPKRHRPSWRRIARALVVPRSAPPRLPRPSATTPATLGYWPGGRPSSLHRPLVAAIEARSVHVRPLGPDLAHLMRAAWTGRAGDIVLIHDLSPLFTASDDGSVLAGTLLFAKTLDHARARGARIVWMPSELMPPSRHAQRFERCIRDLVRRSDMVVTHWADDLEAIKKLGCLAWSYIPHPSLGDALPLMTRDAACATLGLDPSAAIDLHLDALSGVSGMAGMHDLQISGARDRSAFSSSTPVREPDKLVLRGDLAAYAPRHLAAYFAVANVVHATTPTAIALAMAMGRPLVAPPSKSARAMVGGDGLDGMANARRARDATWMAVVDSILGAA